jgi:hypothetical protein
VRIVSTRLDRGTLLVLVALGLPPLPARAQEPAPAAPAAAPAPNPEYDGLVLRALAAYDEQRWDEARLLFERAHALDPTARTLRTIGMTAFNQRDFVGALRQLTPALTDTRKPLTSEQRAHVEGLIELANREVGRYRVRATPADATLVVDGQVPGLLGQDELVLLPGPHELTLAAPGYVTLRRTLEVRAQDRAPLELVLEPVPAHATETRPSAPAAGLPTPASTGVSTDTSAHDGSSTTWGWVALAAGGAGLAVSGVTLALALDDKAHLDDECPDRQCPPQAEDTRARYQTLRIVSPVALGAGVIGVTVGTILLLTGASGDREQAAAGLQPIVAPGYLGVGGRL